jgi:hypothetical protein
MNLTEAAIATITAINISGLAILLWLLTGNENDDQ